MASARDAFARLSTRRHRGPDRAGPPSSGFALLESVARHSRDLIIVTDGAGNVVYANPTALETFDLSLEASLGTLAFKYLHPDDAQRVSQRFFELIETPGASISDEVRVITHDGRTQDLEIVTTNCLDDPTVAGVVVNGRDVSERREYVRGLQAREHWYRTLCARARDLTTVVDDRGQVVWISPANTNISGYAAEDRLGHDVFEVVHPDDIERANEFFTRVLIEGGSSGPEVFRLGVSSGEWRFIEVVATNCLHDPSVGGIIINASDVHERTNLTRALKTLTEGNQILVRASDEPSLLESVCQSIVESGDYLLAWVGFAEHDDARTVRPVVAAGRRGYLDETRFSWGEDEYGGGPTGFAIRTGEVQVLHDVRTRGDLYPWRDAAERHGFRTGCAIPLIVNDEVIGSLSIYAAEPGAFGPAEIDLLGELADDLAYGIGRLRDAARLADHETRLRESEQRFRLAFEQNMAPMLFVDLEDRVIAANAAFCRMTGYTPDELVGRDSSGFTHPDDLGVTEASHRYVSSGHSDQDRYRKRYVRKDGTVIFVEVLRSTARDEEGRALYYVISERDVTEERLLNERISHQGLHDPLTGLANRALFEDRLARAHARTRRSGTSGTVMMLDIDDFKGVNDAHGHLVADQILVAVARRLESVLGANDTLAHFGGDQFLYLGEGLGAPGEAEERAALLLDALAAPFLVADAPLELNASVGVVTWGSKSADPSSLVRDAHVALAEAKGKGRGGFAVFTPTMHQRAVSRFALLQELHQALQCGDVQMHYQPIVDLATLEVAGFEALMRWNHPERGWVPPSAFIPLAEESGLILEIGDFALREAVIEASSWEPVAATGAAPYVSVNLSARQFHDPQLVAKVRDALATSALAPERLVIEITEGAMLRDTTETANVIAQLQDLGVAFALDDFGTGYSSLSYLASLQPRALKIDQSFVRPARSDARHTTLLRTIISLGNQLGIATVAEGIETARQLDQLRRAGCEFGQGFLFSPAAPPEQLRELITTRPWARDDAPDAPTSTTHSRKKS